MKKTVFMKNYNPLKYLLLVDGLCLPFMLALKILQNLLTSFGLSKLIGTIVGICFLLEILSLVFTVLLLIPVFSERKDGLKILSSIKYTLKIRRFLSQTFDSKNGNHPEQELIQDFNRIAYSAVIEVRENKVITYIKSPQKLNSSEKFKNSEKYIRDYISTSFSNYSFGEFEKYPNGFWLIGSKTY